MILEHEIRGGPKQPYAVPLPEEAMSSYRTLFESDAIEAFNSARVHYAQILHQWGLLNARAEILKFVQKVPDQRRDKANNVFGNTCPKCHRQSHVYCKMCRDFASKCSVCHLSVRGPLASLTN